ncbi:MAG TPA: DUF4157 domain-containing protein [Rhizomicrobium sp.]
MTEKKQTGRELAPSVRAPFEQRYGHDFSGVRVHDGSEAAAMTGARGAKAVTVGSDIFFSQGRFAPRSAEGRDLLGHELAHVAQQQEGGQAPDAEARADRAAQKASRGQDVSRAELGGAPVSAQAKPEDGKAADAPGAASEQFGSTLDSFDFNSDAPTEAHRAAIDKLAFGIALHAGMLRGANVSITVSGHTDTAGAEDYNSSLGQRRADKVKAALQEALKKQHGLDKAKIADIVATSQGETAPKIPTKDNVREPRNRRVEITVSITSMPAASADKGPDLSRPLSPGIPPAAGVPPNAKIPMVPAPSQEWLENHFHNDPILKSLPKSVRDPLVGALKDIDETLAEKIIDSLPIEQKDAVTAAVKALLETLKGRKFKPPTPPPVQPGFGPQPQFQQMPGEHILKTPPIPLPHWLGG